MPSYTSSAAHARKPNEALRWEKSDTVLWAFTPNGIVLHNFACGLFVELEGPAYIAWCYLDGIHVADEIAEALTVLPEYKRVPKSGRATIVTKLIADLADGGFIRSVA